MRFRGWILFALGALPFLLHAPYILRAWKTSPLDERDWVFVPLFLLAAFIVLYFHRALEWKRDLVAAIPLALFAGALIVFRFFSVNAPSIASSIGFWWCLLWLLQGWRHAWLLLPPFLILALLTTSSSYWICYMLDVAPETAFIVKLTFSLFCIAWTSVNIPPRFIPARGAFCYSMAFFFAFFLAFQAETLSRTHAPFQPDFPIVFAEYLGKERPIDPNIARFFRESAVSQTLYSGMTDLVFLLRVDCGSDIHEIHPPSHCLRSSGWTVDSERLIDRTIQGRELQVSEIQAHDASGSPILAWAWYSSAEESTGSFLCFRRNWSADAPWTAYLASARIADDLATARKSLSDFLEAAPLPPSHRRSSDAASEE